MKVSIRLHIFGSPEGSRQIAIATDIAAACKIAAALVAASAPGYCCVGLATIRRRGHLGEDLATAWPRSETGQRLATTEAELKAAIEKSLKRIRREKKEVKIRVAWLTELTKGHAFSWSSNPLLSDREFCDHWFKNRFPEAEARAAELGIVRKAGEALAA